MQRDCRCRITSFLVEYTVNSVIRIGGLRSGSELVSTISYTTWSLVSAGMVDSLGP